MPQKAKQKRLTKKESRSQPERVLPSHPNINIRDTLPFHWVPRPHVQNLEPRVAQNIFFDYPIQPGESAWFCAYCFTSFDTQKKATKHFNKKCHFQTKSLGTLTYSRDNIELREIDPIFEKEYCTNLAGYSKLLLQEEVLPVADEDLEHQMFYVLVKKQELSSVVVGLFTRGKEVNNQVLCRMLVFPPYRQLGFGRLILEIAHGISAARKCIGNPDLPWPQSFAPLFLKFIIIKIVEHVFENEEFFENNLHKFLLYVTDYTGLHPLRVAEVLIAKRWINADRSLNLEKIRMEGAQAYIASEFFLEFDSNCLTLPKSQYFTTYSRFHRISDSRTFIPLLSENMDGRQVAVINVHPEMWLHVKQLMKMSSKGKVERDGMSCRCSEPGSSLDGPCKCQEPPLYVE